jgi:chromosome segregation ATPase
MQEEIKELNKQILDIKRNIEEELNQTTQFIEQSTFSKLQKETQQFQLMYEKDQHTKQELQIELDEIKQQKCQAHEQIEQIQKQNNELFKQLEEHKTLVNLKIDIIKIKQSLIEKYQSMYFEEQIKNKEFQKQIEKQQTEKEQLIKHFEEILKENQNHKIQIEEQTNEFDQIKIKKFKLKEQNLDFSSDVKQYNNSLCSYPHDIENLTKINPELYNTSNLSLTKIENFQIKYQKVQSKNETVFQTGKILKITIEKQIKELEHQQIENSTLKKNIQILNNKIRTLQFDIENLTKLNHDLSNSIKSEIQHLDLLNPNKELTEQLSHSFPEIQSLTKEKEDFQNYIIILNNQITSLQNQNHILKFKLLPKKGQIFKLML